MAKILWLSDAGCTTGFARVTHSIGERLVEDYGHEIHVLAVNYKGDSWTSERDPSKVTPLRLYRPDTIRGDDIYGKSRVFELLTKLEPDLVVSLNDPQIMLGFLFRNQQYDPKQLLLQYRPILYYVPCDGINLPPTWTDVLPLVTNVVAMSKWGQEQYKGSKLVYHGLDQNLWWPISERPKVTTTGIVCRSKTECRKAFGLDPDMFLVGRVDTNSGRKDYPALVKALWPLMKRDKSIRAWFHCEDVASNGIRFQSMFEREPDVESDRFIFPGLHTSYAGWAQQDMNVLMSCFDVFASTSRGEGFGLTLLEAAACGIPIVAQNVSAIPEVVGPGGILLQPSDRLLTVPSGEDVWLPDIDAFTSAIGRLRESSGLRRDLGEAGAAHARTFSWDVAASKFHEYVTALEHFQAPELPVATEASESQDAVLQQL